MKAIYVKLLAVVLCLSMLCACGAENTPGAGDESTNTPGTENTTPDNGTQKDDTSTVPDESGDAAGDSSDGENTSPVYTELTSEELAEWESYFNATENNGLLRFPYSDPASDPDQLAPYLVWLFYDIGELSISDEERALLAATDFMLELDTFRLSREFMNSYLKEHFNIPAAKTENLLDAAKLGTYLLLYDAWYIAHGDTEYRFYEFDHGVQLEDGTVKLYYFNDFLRVVQEDGEMDYIDAEMVVTLIPGGNGTWYVASHEIDSSPYGQ